ncbi:MAG: DUF4293 domain-containing protein [Paludibacteraceae bacterium]|nr:DUF4293 domain-containing protein [Paludibacteraceae bacterium]
MIQRIQTIFLLVSTILAICMFIFPLEELFTPSAGTYEFGLLGVSQNGELLYSTWPLLVLAILCTLLSAGAIFCYTDRILQSRLCILNILLWIGFCVMFFVYAFINGEKFEITTTSYKMTMIFPIVNIVLALMANKKIQKDEDLVRSLDRLR